MADKFRTTYPINVTFAASEQPSSTKLNAINTQAKNGLALVERALGDVWNQSGDSVYGDYPLHITNVARALGDQAKLNPYLPAPDLSVGEEITIHQTIAESTTELQLDFSPVGDVGGTLETLILTNGFTTRVNSREEVNSADKFYIDIDNAKVFLGSAWPITYVEYNVSAEKLPSEEQPSANMIPHPQQQDWKGLKISKVSDNKYLLFLPPRRPLSTGTIGKMPPESNNSVIPGVSPVHRYWYVDAGAWAGGTNPETNASYADIVLDKRYRYKLPEPLYEMMTEAGASGSAFPSGSIYLWDSSTETIIEGLTFRVPSVNSAYGSLVSPRPTWVIQVEGNGLDSLFSTYASGLTTDDPADYQSRFALITVGNSTADAIQSLYRTLLTDTHSTGLLPRVRHSDLLGNQPHSQTRFNPLPPSYIDGDDHPHLLSRQGSTSNTSLQRDRYNNGMLGDLLLLSKDPSNNRQNTLGDSQALVFGSLTTGPTISFAKNLFPTDTEASAGKDALRIMGAGIYLEPARIGFPGGGIIHSEDYGELYTYGSGNQYGELDFFTGSVNTVYNGGPITGLVNTSKSIKLHSLDTANRIDFLGNDLSLLSPGESRNVVIGHTVTSPNTHLRLSNDNLYFGEGNARLARLDHSSLGAAFYFFSGGSSDSGVFADYLFARKQKVFFDTYDSDIGISYSFTGDEEIFRLHGYQGATGSLATSSILVGPIGNGTNPVLSKAPIPGYGLSISGGLIVTGGDIRGSKIIATNAEISHLASNIEPAGQSINLGSIFSPWNHVYTEGISAGDDNASFSSAKGLLSGAVINFQSDRSGITLSSISGNPSIGFIQFNGSAGGDIILNQGGGTYDEIRVRVNNQVRWLRCYH